MREEKMEDLPNRNNTLPGKLSYPERSNSTKCFRKLKSFPMIDITHSPFKSDHFPKKSDTFLEEIIIIGEVL